MVSLVGTSALGAVILPRSPDEESPIMYLGCPKCRQPVSLIDHEAGTIMACVRCGQQMRVPQTLPIVPAPAPEVPTLSAATVPAPPARPGPSTPSSEQREGTLHDLELVSEDEPNSASLRQRTRQRAPAWVAAAKLGDLLETFAPPYRLGATLGSPLLVIVGLVLLAAVPFILTFAQPGTGRIAGAMILGGSVLAFMGARMFFHSLRGTGIRVFVCEKGYAESRLFSRRIVLWDDVEGIHLQSHDGLHGLESVIEVELIGGDRLTYFASLQGLEAMDRLIQERLLQVRWKSMCAELRLGRSIRFGAVLVSADGICYREEWLRWADVGEIEFTHKEVRIYQRHVARPWARVPLARVPNRFLLEAMAQQVRRAAA